MTVGELIAELEKLPRDMAVIRTSGPDEDTITDAVGPETRQMRSTGGGDWIDPNPYNKDGEPLQTVVEIW